MIDTLSYKAAHHQNQTIEHLKYENELLAKRNQALSSENARLLQELSKCMSDMESFSMGKINQVLQEQQELSKLARKDCSQLFEGLDNKTRKIIGSLVNVYRQSINSKDCSFSSIYSSLREIIAKLLHHSKQNKQLKLKQYLNANQQRLVMRKAAREQTNSVVHLIKEPPTQINPQYRHMMDELNSQADIYHRIIRKVKKQTTNVHTLNNIYHQIRELGETKWRLRMQQSRLIILERQFQLGQFHPLDQQTSSSLIRQLGQNIKAEKAQLQGQISGLV